MKANFNVQLYKNRKIVWLVSFSLSLISIIGMLICLKSTSINAPLNLGLDYTGGTQIILERGCTSDCIPLNTSDISNNIIALKKYPSQAKTPQTISMSCKRATKEKMSIFDHI